MKPLKLIMASVALSLIALFPEAAMADDDELDVTMEVFDSVADFDGPVIVMEGPTGHENDGSDGDGDEQRREKDSDLRTAGLERLPKYGRLSEELAELENAEDAQQAQNTNDKELGCGVV